MNTALVSVVVPAYNAANTILSSVSSALAQSHCDVEVIICDDASTDATYEIAASIDDPRVRILRNEDNLGAGKTRDRAIACAKGEWIALLDADDRWTPRRLESLLCEAQGPELIFDDIRLCILVGNQLVEGPRVHGARAFGCKGKSASVSLRSFLASDRLLVQPIFPTSFIRENKISHSPRRFGEDAEFYINCALKGIQMRYVPRAQYLYRVGQGSLTSAPRERGEMEDMLSTFLDHPAFSDEERRALIDKLYRLSLDDQAGDIVQMIGKGKVSEGVRALAKTPAVLRRMASRSPTRIKLEIRRLIAVVAVKMGLYGKSRPEGYP